MDRVLTFPERRAGLCIVLLGTLFALAYATSLVVRPKPSGRIVVGDALHHYVQLRSVVFDGDLHFRNEYIRMYDLQGGEPGTEWVYEDTPTGHVRNLMPVGPALLWTPLFLATASGVALANAAGGSYAVDGYGRAFQATAGLSGIMAATAGVWLTWMLSSHLFGRRAAAWGTITMWLASSAIYYSLISPTYSHAPSLLLSSAFWYYWIVSRTTAPAKRYGVLGLLAGTASLMRWQDAVLLCAVAIDLASSAQLRPRPIATRVGYGAVAVMAAALAFTPQMAVWYVLYGQPLAIPQGPSFMRWGEPALIQVLFSDNHGLFTWTPIAALSLLGLRPLWRQDQDLARATCTFLLVSWYVNAAAADWWAGEAFGARRFLSSFPVFALMLSGAIAAWRPPLRRLAAACTAVVVFTGLLLLQYQLFMHGFRDIAPYPRGPYGMWVARFVVPFDIAREWILQ